MTESIELSEHYLNKVYQETLSMSEFLSKIIKPYMTDEIVLNLVNWYQDQIKYQLILGSYTRTYGDSRPTYVLIEPDIDDKSHIYMMHVVETDDLKSRPGYRMSDFEKIKLELRNGWHINDIPSRLTERTTSHQF